MSKVIEFPTWRDPGPLENLTARDVQSLLDEIALVAETAYRRGFQQGLQEAETSGLKANEAWAYRYVRPLELAIGAPFKNKEGEVQYAPEHSSTIERHLEMEKGPGPYIKSLLEMARRQ